MSDQAMEPPKGIGLAQQLESCPYNMSHQIMHYKMAQHLVKCRQQYPDSKTKTCPFDVRHVVNEAELDFHVRNCPARHMLDTAMYDVDPSVSHVPPPRPVPEVCPEENWDNEAFQSYNPREATSKATHVIRKLPGCTPSERRAFRMAERTRYGRDASS